MITNSVLIIVVGAMNLIVVLRTRDFAVTENGKAVTKMTPEEAIKTIRVAIAEVEWDYPLDYAIAFETAIEALEKQIQKKPRAHTVDVDKLKIGNANWCKGTTVYRCPNCNDFISRIYDFCYKCGQKIDWGNDK